MKVLFPSYVHKLYYYYMATNCKLPDWILRILIHYRFLSIHCLLYNETSWCHGNISSLNIGHT